MQQVFHRFVKKIWIEFLRTNVGARFLLRGRARLVINQRAEDCAQSCALLSNGIGTKGHRCAALIDHVAARERLLTRELNTSRSLSDHRVAPKVVRTGVAHQRYDEPTGVRGARRGVGPVVDYSAGVCDRPTTVPGWCAMQLLGDCAQYESDPSRTIPGSDGQHMPDGGCSSSPTTG